MHLHHHLPLSKRITNTLAVTSAIAVLAASTVFNAPSGASNLWSAYVWGNSAVTVSTPEASINVKAEEEMRKFNLIWYYLARVDPSLGYHQQQYTTNRSFLMACHGFDDYIASLHHMIYSAHALDIQTLNSIYPELGNRFQNFYIKGANLMLNACINGSEKQYVESRIASDSWFKWYESNGKSIEASLKQALK